MGIKPIDFEKRQDWIVKIQHGPDDDEYVTLQDKTFAEMQLYAIGNWPLAYAADRVIASPLIQWTA